MELKKTLFEVKDGVATVTLNQPELANAVETEAMRELHWIANQCDERKDIRAVLLTGSGDFFCAGGDLKYFQSRGDERGIALKETTTYLHAAIARFTKMDAPYIIAVNGMAAGGGFSLSLTGDIVLASDKARFLSAYTAAGLCVDGSSSYFLPRLVGLRKAQELIMTNRILSAEEALEWGLVTRVVPHAELMKEARALAAEMAQGPTRSFGRVKRQLENTFGNSLEQQMELETRLIAEAALSADGREGIDAFINKRKPAFKGE